MKDTEVKTKTQEHKDLKPLEVRDMVYIREEVGVHKGEFRDLCQVKAIRQHSKSYYVESKKLKESKSETHFAQDHQTDVCGDEQDQ